MYKKELKIAIKAVKNSEKTFLKYHGKRVGVRTKNHNPRDLVTYADKKIEADIFKYLAKKTPSFGFIGEEGHMENLDSEMVWVLDPIDGTTNYLHGQADCCISLALQKNGTPVVGVVYSPIQNILFTGAVGEKAKKNGKKIAVSRVNSVTKAFVAFAWAKDRKFATKHFEKVVNSALNIRVAGSIALAYCYIAEGSFDLLYSKKNPNPWDIAAGEVIAQEAGAKIKIKNNIQFVGNKNIIKKI